MSIAQSLKLFTLITIALIIALGAGFIFFYTDTEKMLRKNQAAHKVSDEVLHFSLAAHDYFISRTPRAQNQWSSAYESLRASILSALAVYQETGTARGEGMHLNMLKSHSGKLDDLFQKINALSVQEKPQGVNTTKRTFIKSLYTDTVIITSLLLSTDAMKLYTLSREKLLHANGNKSAYFFFCLVTLGIVALSWHAFNRRKIVTPLKTLHHHVEKIGTGDLDHTIPIESIDEIGNLSAVFNTMLRNLKSMTVSRNDLIREMQERTAVEQRLLRMNQSLEAAQKTARLGFWRFHLKSGFREWSEEMFSIYGVPPENGTPPYNDLIERIEPEDRQLFDTSVRQCREQGTPYDIIIRIPFPDASLHSIHTLGFPRYDKKGDIFEIFGTSQDITQSRESEAALIKSEAMLAESQRLAHIGSWEYSPAEDKLVWSREVFHIFGLPPDTEPSYKVFINVVHPDDRDLLDREIRASAPYRTDYRIVRPDGSTRHIHEEVRSLEGDGGMPSFIWGTAQDVTDIKMAEFSLAQEEERWRHTFDSITDLVSVHDREFRFIKANRAFARFLGTTPEKLAGRHCYKMMHCTDSPVADCPFAEMLATGKTVRRDIYDSRSRQHLEVTASPIFSNSHVSGGVHFIKNITRQKESSKEREALLAELESKNRELEQLIYVTSHDLRSPLININGFTRAINDSLDEIETILQHQSVPEHIRERVGSIVRQEIHQAEHFISGSVSRMESLLSGLLQLSRLGRIEFTFEQIDVNSLVAGVAQSIAYQIDEKGISLHIEDLPPCRADRRRLNQVFANLLDNAMKFLDPARRGVITVSGRVTDSSSVYCVTDNGIGIKKDHQKKIFDVFYQLNPAEGKGEGLGLTIIRKILAAHKGSIWVDSEFGRGCTFCISIPDRIQP